MSLLTLTTALLFVLAAPVFAQESLDVHAGMTTNQAEARKTPIDTFGDGVLYNAPRMTGAFPKFGANLKMTPWPGAGGERSWRASKGGHAALMYRPQFHDFCGMYTPPAKSKRLVPEPQAGMGAANLRFYHGQRLCNNFTGCRTSSSLAGTDKKFTAHFGGGFKTFIHNNGHVKPEFKLRRVNDLFQFVRNWVPEYGLPARHTSGGR